MTVVAITMVRDEADIIAHTLNHLLDQGIDHIVVADNMSTDNTGFILRDFAEVANVTVLEDDEPGYYQDQKMTELARFATRMFNPDWILPFDADEYWYWADGTLAEAFQQLTCDHITATGWDHIVTDDDDPTESNPYKRIGHRRQSPQKFGKVAFRPHPDAWIDYGNHQLFNHPGRHGLALNYRHFQYRSFEQMVSKVANGASALAAGNLHPGFGTHWRQLANQDDAQLWAHWRRLCEEPGLIYDPAP